MMTETNINDEKFKIQGVGIDTSTIITKPWLEEGGEIFDYIHTSISANNDFLLSEYIKNQPGAALITTIDFINNPERALLGHIIELERKKIDLLLVSGDALENKINEFDEIIKSLKTSKLIEEFGISCPSSVEQIEKISKAYSGNIKFISLNICPLNFNYDIIEYCRSNNIDILGFNPFGGYISAPGIINSFTIPYLLAFSSTYSTILFVSGRDLFSAIDCREYIKNNIIGSNTSSRFILKKNVSRLYKPFKKVVDTSLIIDDKTTLSYNIPTVMYPLSDICITLGKTYNIIPKKEDTTRTNIEKEIYDLLDITEFPDNCSQENKYAISRYQILGLLRVKYPKEDGWTMNLVNIGDKILGIGVVRKIKEKKSKFWKGKTKEEYNYFLLAVPDKDTIIFTENIDIKNSAEVE